MSEVQKCRECGGDNLLWTQCNSNKTSVAEGRLRTHEITCSFVLGCEDCSETIAVISADKFITNYEAAKGELAALREELANHRLASAQRIERCAAREDELQQRLTAAEQLNAELEKNAARYVWLRDKSESIHQFYLSTPIWFTSVKFNKENVDNTIDAAIKPTESGASE